MTIGDASSRRPTLRLRAANAELHGPPGETVIFRLSLLNGLATSETFSYHLAADDGDFEGDLRAPPGAVAPGQAVQVEVEIKIPERLAPGKYILQVAAVLRRDETIGVAEDVVVTVDAARPANLPWVAGAVGVTAIALLAALLISQLDGGSDKEAVLGESATPAITTNGFPSVVASSNPTEAPTATPAAESPTVPVTDEPTAVPGNQAPAVTITDPSPGQVFCATDDLVEITMQADVSDEEDGFVPNEQIAWTFALDGGEPEFLANSAVVGLELHVTAEQSRTVDVSVEATDSEGLVSESSIQLVAAGAEAEGC